MIGMFTQDPATCSYGPHRVPQGPNEDVAVCYACGGVSWTLRPVGETFGTHFPDCALPVRHEGQCEHGGTGHPEAPRIRGHWRREADQ